MQMCCTSSPVQPDSTNPDLPTLLLFLPWASLHQAANLPYKAKFCSAVKCPLKAKIASMSSFYTRGLNPEPKTHIKKKLLDWICLKVVAKTGVRINKKILQQSYANVQLDRLLGQRSTEWGNVLTSASYHLQLRKIPKLIHLNLIFPIRHIWKPCITLSVHAAAPEIKLIIKFQICIFRVVVFLNKYVLFAYMNAFVLS